MTVDTAPRAIGATSSSGVGGYELLGELGRGAMAVVHLARQRDLDRLVALKEMSALRAADGSLARRFLREARLAGSIGDPNVITVYEYLEHRGTPYIAMEHAAGGSLRPWVGHMTEAQVAGVLEGVLSALAAAHARGVVHRDLKPENVLVTVDGRVKVTDFGIAKATSSVQTALTAAGAAVGTPVYMSPEQAMADTVGPWSDLYSVGCMAYELFTGAPPFGGGDSPLAVMFRHVNEQVPPASEVADIPVDVSDWIDALLAKDPGDRCRTAAEAWDGLEDIVVRRLGPLWRRNCRLVDGSGAGGAAGGVPDPPTLETRMPPTVTTLAMSPAAPAPARSSRARSWRGTLVATAASVAGLGLTGAAAAGALGTAGPASPDRTPSVRVSSADVALVAPQGWRRLDRAPEVPGLALEQAVAIGAGAGSVVAGMVTGELPSAIRRPGARREPVRLTGDGLQAHRYTGIPGTLGSDVTAVFTAPSSSGLAAVVCLAPAAIRTCDAIAGTLDLRRAQPVPLGPSPVVARRLRTALRDLDSALERHGSRLAGAADAEEHAGGADAVAAAYGSATIAVGRIADPTPGGRRATLTLLRALRSARAAYRSVAEAAAALDQAAHRRARRAATRARGALGEALDGLRRVGYKVS